MAGFFDVGVGWQRVENRLQTLGRLTIGGGDDRESAVKDRFGGLGERRRLGNGPHDLTVDFDRAHVTGKLNAAIVARLRQGPLMGDAHATDRGVEDINTGRPYCAAQGFAQFYALMSPAFECDHGLGGVAGIVACGRDAKIRLKETLMKRSILASLCLLMLVSCGGSGAGVTMDDLKKSNDDLTRRVKSLEEQLLESDKKLIQHQQALQVMHERLRDVETAIGKIQMGPAR